MRFVRKSVLLLLTAFLLLAELGCGDQYRPVANPVVSPGGQPQTTHYAWVLNYNPSGGDGSTTEIDVSGDTNLAVNAMGVGSSYEAFPASSLSLYVANSGDDTVDQYLPTLSGAITTISLLPGSDPVALVSTNNSSMFVLNAGSNSACPNTGSISTINTSTLSVSNTTCVGSNPTAMVQASTNGWIYVINQGDNSISVFNPGVPGVVGTITTQDHLGLNPIALAVNAQGWIFIVNKGDGVNPGTLQLCPTGFFYIAGTTPLGVQPTQAVIDPNRNRLYVTNSGDNTVSVFDASSITQQGNPPLPLLATVPVGTGAKPVSVIALLDGTNFYVANAGSSTVTVVSQSSFTPLSTVALPSGANPVWIAADPTSQKVYVADSGTSETTIIQTSNNTVTQNIAAPTQISGCTSGCALQTPVMIVTQ
jgi:DNA-binding beta-propeller fold protein YncE